MTAGPVRRTQLIAPFGVGALQVNSEGTSLITAGLDHWYENNDGSDPDDPTEFRISEWRLENLLSVNNLRLPPDYRQLRRNQARQTNSELTIPALRFPRMHFCPFCQNLAKLPLDLLERRPNCPSCLNTKNYRNRLYQVQIVCMCEAGHLSDFPWSEWVHRCKDPTCQGTMKLKGGTGGQQGDQTIQCAKNEEGGCGMSRRLGNIWEAYDDGSTYLTNNLTKPTASSDVGASMDNSSTVNDEDLFLCQGQRPWVGDQTGSGCGRSLRASFRAASNLYYPTTKSSVYIPRETDIAPSELVSLMEGPVAASFISLAGPSTEVTQITNAMRRTLPQQLAGYTDAQINEAIRIVRRDDASTTHIETPVEDVDIAFRYEEFTILRSDRDYSELQIQEIVLDKYDESIQKNFEKITLIHKLRETRALTGFTRVNSGNDFTHTAQDFLWETPPGDGDRWLPACVVHGEGIYIEFDAANLSSWEDRADVISRIKPLSDRYAHLQAQRTLEERTVTPRLVLVHTFAHLLINQLTFECGYSSAALRERLYVSTARDNEMAGVLIYTASGDTDGTMGGLVRMGKPGNLEAVMTRSIENARWCSADPVCMELGSRAIGGQGPDGCNLAACHSCALVPETACEEFNRFLDRGVTVGSLEIGSEGYFEFDADSNS